MKLLLVDDEALTREGLLTHIDWQALGIEEVLTADDGCNGLATAKQAKPEIIMSDVRMPRMNGIDMIIAIRAFLPNSSVIFMSGYSDKEYLKAAIKLKAVNYVEKPIELAEVTAAIADAVAATREQQVKLQSLFLQKLVTSNQLALDLAHHQQDITSVMKQFNAIGIPVKSTTHFLCVIVSLHAAIFKKDYEEKLQLLYQELEQFSKHSHFRVIHGVKPDDYILFHIIFQDSLSHHTLQQFGQIILNRLSSDCNLFITVGREVADCRLIFTSYNSAVILLQVAFYYEFNQILFDEDVSYTSYQVPEALWDSYTDALREQNYSAVAALLDSLFVSFRKNPYTLVNYVKEVYYKLFHTLSTLANTLHINLAEDTVDYESILHAIASCPALTLLHRILMSKVDKFFECIAHKQSEDSTIGLIKDYIGKNYRRDSLSVKDISECVYLSPSYVCTIFKNATGQTLNQFLTEYRVNKAKQLLSDSRCKITDVSSKVGYADSNYFGKTFKKITGLSPSEFRENHLL